MYLKLTHKIIARFDVRGSSSGEVHFKIQAGSVRDSEFYELWFWFLFVKYGTGCRFMSVHYTTIKATWQHVHAAT
jgi:hypothetical protein